MITLTTFQMMLFLLIMLAFPIMFHFRTKTLMSLLAINNNLKKDIRAKDKVIDELVTAISGLETEKKDLSDKLEMLEEALTRAGITADVWNTEDKVDDA